MGKTMQIIYSGDILNVTPFSKGFIVAVREENEVGKVVIRYYGYDAINKGYTRIKKSVFLKIKFGYECEAIVDNIKDYISCDTAFLNDGRIMAIFPNGNFSVFNTNGTLSLSSSLSYRDHAACDITADDDYVWSAVPGDNSVIRYSPKDGRISLRIGGGENTAFDQPTSVFILGNTLYVCNRASRKIMALNTVTGEAKDYRVFREHVIKYINVQSTEFVWLSSGLYIMD